MNYKKIANAGFEEVSCATTRSTSRHGLGRRLRRGKRAYNRAAKRIEASVHIADQLTLEDVARIELEVEVEHSDYLKEVGFA